MQERINSIRASAPKERFLRALVEPENHVPETRLFIRGDHNQPGEPVGAGELTVLASYVATKIPSKHEELPTTGRRLAYAKHLTSGSHPLVTRVLANRVWMHHFGRGIVNTPGDFGVLGAKPSHPELLDWLASEIVRDGWHLKRLHRTIMLSQTYRQRSTRNAALDEVDPSNQWYARMSVRRLESESIRDAVLAVSGELSSEMAGPPIPVREDGVGQIVIGKEMLDGERKPTKRDGATPGAARRSIYIQVRRSRPLAVLETFDIATMSPNCTKRNYSNVAPQSLMMMNSHFVIEHADRMARTLDSLPSMQAKIKTAWRRCYATAIADDALRQLTDFVDRQTKLFEQRNPDGSTAEASQRALATLCQSLISSNQFVYVD